MNVVIYGISDDIMIIFKINSINPDTFVLISSDKVRRGNKCDTSISVFRIYTDYAIERINIFSIINITRHQDIYKFILLYQYFNGISGTYTVKIHTRYNQYNNKYRDNTYKHVSFQRKYNSFSLIYSLTLSGTRYRIVLFSFILFLISDELISITGLFPHIILFINLLNLLSSLTPGRFIMINFTSWN